MKPRTVLMFTGLASLAAAAALGLVALFGAGNVASERLLGTTFAVGIATMFVMAALWSGDRGAPDWLVAVACVTSLGALGLFLAFVWGVFQGNTVAQRLAVRFLSGTVALACWSVHASLLWTVRASLPWTRAMRLIAAMCGAAVAAGVVVVAIDRSWLPLLDTWALRLLIAVLLVGLAATIALPIVRRLEKATAESDYERTIGESLKVSLCCPRCAATLSVESNAESACAACGLRIKVLIEEPRCAGCGYLLYGLAGRTCPECGRPSQRWGGEAGSRGDAAMPVKEGSAPS